MSELLLGGRSVRLDVLDGLGHVTDPLFQFRVSLFLILDRSVLREDLEVSSCNGLLELNDLLLMVSVLRNQSSVLRN